NSVVQEGQAMPLGFVRFFDPAHEGIAVEAADKAVRIKEVQLGKPFARAGLRAGDVLLTLDGAEVGSGETFRKTLRKLMAEGTEATFRVRRADRVLDLPVRFAADKPPDK